MPGPTKGIGDNHARLHPQLVRMGAFRVEYLVRSESKQGQSWSLSQYLQARIRVRVGVIQNSLTLHGQCNDPLFSH